jgi:hypothetical protein
MSKTIKNAIIESARMTTDDHGCLCVWLMLDYGGTGQGFGGYKIGTDQSAEKNMEYKKGNIAAAFIVGCMRAADATDWSRMIGKSIRVRMESDGWNAKIEAIGHITKDDRWFCPKEVFADA